MEIDVKISDIGLDEVEVTEILVKEGQSIVKEQGLVTVEGQKASMEIPSNYSGIIKKIKVKIGDKVRKGTSILILEKDVSVDIDQHLASIDKEKIEINYSNKIKNSFLKKKIGDKKIVHASPLVRRLSRQLNVDLQNIKGSGIKNRILREDLSRCLSKQSSKQLDKNCNTFSINQDNYDCNSNLNKSGKIDTVKLSNFQQTLAVNLYKNWKNIPHVTQFDKSDVTDLESFRKNLNINKRINEKRVKLTLLVFLIKVIVCALKKFPLFNSSLSNKNSTLTLKKYFNIGIAVDTEKGLFVPVLKNVDKKSIYDISEELIFFTKKAREGKLNFEDMQGGCFTISNLGGLGGLNFTPIINAPEVAILGLSKCVIEPIWKIDKFKPRLMLPLSLSYDHRVINGADAVRFISFINEHLSDIRLLVLS